MLTWFLITAALGAGDAKKLYIREAVGKRTAIRPRLAYSRFVRNADALKEHDTLIASLDRGRGSQ